MSLLKASHKTRTKLRELRDQRPDGSQRPGAQAAWSPSDLLICRLATPLVPGVAAAEKSANTAEAYVVVQDRTDMPMRRAVLQDLITDQPTNRDIVVSGDLTNWLVAGSRFLVRGSTSNDQQYYLCDITYSSGDNETTLNVTPDLPDAATADGNVVRLGPYGLSQQVEVRNLSGHAAIAAMPGDDIICARIGAELIPLAGPQVIFGQVTETIDPPTIDTANGDILTLGTGKVSVYYFDTNGVRTDTGIDVEISNDWEDITIEVDFTIKADWYGRWMLTQASCSETEATLA